MKRLISAAIALTLLGTAAASAQSYRHGGYGYGGYGHGGYSRGWHGRGNNDGALIGLGIGLFALGAIAAASSHDRYEDRYDYAPPPPPPAYGPRSGYDNGYDRGYGYGY